MAIGPLRRELDARAVDVRAELERRSRRPSMRSARLKTWKPPLSVRIGPSQPMNACRPPSAATVCSPGRSARWYVLARIICAPVSRSRPGSTPLTVPCVPTGMKAGVSTTPCGVVKRARRARMRRRRAAASKRNAGDSHRSMPDGDAWPNIRAPTSSTDSVAAELEALNA